MKKFDEKIEEIEKKIHHLETDTRVNYQKFAGIAFISFERENHKSEIVSQNAISFWEDLK